MSNFADLFLYLMRISALQHNGYKSIFLVGQNIDYNQRKKILVMLSA